MRAFRALIIGLLIGFVAGAIVMAWFLNSRSVQQITTPAPGVTEPAPQAKSPPTLEPIEPNAPAPEPK